MEPMPNVLLVEDDPISCSVLGAALERCSLNVETAGCVRDALYVAARGRHALWLIDAHLPDGSGIALLEALRRIDADAVAIAHTASQDLALHRLLRAAGFAEVLVKPLASATLAAALALWLPVTQLRAVPVDDVLPTRGAPEAQVWDDEAALRAMAGNATHVAALRALFLAELPAVLQRVTSAVVTSDGSALHAELHRLHASCGFVGAAALAVAAHELGMRADAASLARFERAFHALLATVRDAQSA
ncbi:response regulator [Lysobacter korlensis]|uniref:Response regulator n=1 Tax=Lysobacter korlensis TaxID=553636 RepID=A0ABV6RKV9_9GAMM